MQNRLKKWNNNCNRSAVKQTRIRIGTEYRKNLIETYRKEDNKIMKFCKTVRIYTFLFLSVDQIDSIRHSSIIIL